MSSRHTLPSGQYYIFCRGDRQACRKDTFYDDNAVLEEHNAADGSLLAHYRYADRLLSLTTTAGSQFYHYDGLGSTVNLTDTTGSTKVSYLLDPWGNIKEQIGDSINRQIFTGQEHDENTGLIYFGARFYDPEIGRFISQDSYLGESGTPPSLHRYLYAYGKTGLANAKENLSNYYATAIAAASKVKRIITTEDRQGSGTIEGVPLDQHTTPQLGGFEGDQLAQEIKTTTFPADFEPHSQLEGFGAGNTSQTQLLPPSQGLSESDKELLNDPMMAEGSGDVSKRGERLYDHIDEAGDVNYIGITNDLKKRAGQHRIDTEKTGQTMKPTTDVLTHDQARTIEAMKIRQRLSEVRAKGLIDGTEPVAEQLRKAGLLNKNRGRDPNRWVDVDPDDFVQDFDDSYDIRTPRRD